MAPKTHLADELWVDCNVDDSPHDTVAVDKLQRHFAHREVGEELVQRKQSHCEALKPCAKELTGLSPHQNQLAHLFAEEPRLAVAHHCHNKRQRFLRKADAHVPPMF